MKPSFESANAMKSKKRLLALCILSLFILHPIATAQDLGTKTIKTNNVKTDDGNVVPGEDAGNYTIIGSIEFGYRGLSVDGDLNKYKSDLNYTPGPRLFDSNFLMKSK